MENILWRCITLIPIRFIEKTVKKNYKFYFRFSPFFNLKIIQIFFEETLNIIY